MTTFEILIIFLGLSALWKFDRLFPDPPEKPAEPAPPAPVRHAPLLSRKANWEMQERAAKFANANKNFIRNYRN
jgi:hypothetical protein